MRKSSFDSLFCQNIDDLVFRIALEYENFSRGETSKLKIANLVSHAKRNAIIAKTGISCVKRSDDELVIYLVVNHYILKAMGEYYQFEGMPIGRNFGLNGHLVAFTGPPQVLMKQHYNHPFVYSDNEICYRKESKRWERLGIRWNYWYDTTDETTPFKIAKWLEQGRLSLQRGYFGDVSPVHELGTENFRSEYRAPNEAIKSGLRIVESIR